MTTNLKQPSDLPYVFFGTGAIALGVLDELERARQLPALIVTAPDAPAGRGHTLTPSLVAQWAQQRGIPTLKPAALNATFVSELRATSHKLQVILFVVADYGKILPREVLHIPPRGIVNMHPSLLPKLRGPSPIRSAILGDERDTGVTIMLIDEKMDHGPILAQKKIPVPRPPAGGGPLRGRELDGLLAREGGALLSETLPRYVAGGIVPREQDHAQATFTHFLKKEDGLLDLSADAYHNLLKIRAFDGWPGTYTFFERHGKQVRVRITEAHLENEKLVLDRVVPEGKSEMPYADFARSLS